MARLGKYKIIYGLLALVVLEFAGLVGVLLFDGAPARAQAESPPEESLEAPEEVPADDVMPAWLEPFPDEVVEREAPEGELTALEILSGAQIIAHGMGSLDGETTLNCLEGFRDRYDRGVRVFEVDLRLTSDQKVVLRHDWRAGWQAGVSETSIPTVDEFLDKPILKKYTPLSFKDLLYLMQDYPDICVVTDTKFTDAEIVKLQFEAMLQDARDLGLSYLLDRMIIQVYSPLMFQVVDSLHHFPYYIYTLYSDGFSRTEEDFRERADFCRENKILGITMWDYWWREEFTPIAGEYGLRLYTHTVNDPEEAAALLEAGVGAVYTDELVPGDLLQPASPEDAAGSGDGPEDLTESGDAAEPSPEGEEAPEEGAAPAPDAGEEPAEETPDGDHAEQDDSDEKGE